MGTAKARESAQVHAELAGIVQSILFMEGQPTRGGEVLLKIDDSRLRAEADSSHAEF